MRIDPVVQWKKNSEVFCDFGGAMFCKVDVLSGCRTPRRGGRYHVKGNERVGTAAAAFCTAVGT